LTTTLALARLPFLTEKQQQQQQQQRQQRQQQQVNEPGCTVFRIII